MRTTGFRAAARGDREHPAATRARSRRIRVRRTIIRRRDSSDRLPLSSSRRILTASMPGKANSSEIACHTLGLESSVGENVGLPIAVGAAFSRAAPRTDPDVPYCGIRLLPWVWLAMSHPDEKVLDGPRVQNSGPREPAIYSWSHALPSRAVLVATTPKRLVPGAPDLGAKRPQRVDVRGNSMVGVEPTHDAAQPLALLNDGVVAAPLQLGFYLQKLRPQSSLLGMPHQNEIPPLTFADMGP